MKLNRLLLWAVVLLAVSPALVLAQTSEYISCQVQVVPSGSMLGVELTGATSWNIGPIPQGGVADTWLGKNPHGTFGVRCKSATNSALFVTAEKTDALTPVECLPPIDGFAMGIATNVMDVLPSWMLLDDKYPSTKVGRFLTYLRPGEYLLFDLRFYAPVDITTGSDGFKVGLWVMYAETDEP